MTQDTMNGGCVNFFASLFNYLWKWGTNAWLQIHELFLHPYFILSHKRMGIMQIGNNSQKNFPCLESNLRPTKL